MRQTKVPEGHSLAYEVFDALSNAPIFFVEMLISLFILVISDIFIATFAITAALVGLAAGDWKVGLAVFFVIYSGSRILNTIANAIGSAGQNVAMGINNGLVQHGHAIRMATDLTPVPDSETLPN